MGDASGYLRKLTPDQFTLWCSGRRRCDWVLAVLRLQKRQVCVCVCAAFLIGSACVIARLGTFTFG